MKREVNMINLLSVFIGGGIGPGDVERLKAFQHPKCIGIDLNSKFEIEPVLNSEETFKGKRVKK